jgi:hypothetical protein
VFELKSLCLLLTNLLDYYKTQTIREFFTLFSNVDLPVLLLPNAWNSHPPQLGNPPNSFFFEEIELRLASVWLMVVPCSGSYLVFASFLAQETSSVSPCFILYSLRLTLVSLEWRLLLAVEQWLRGRTCNSIEEDRVVEVFVLKQGRRGGNCALSLGCLLLLHCLLSFLHPFSPLNRFHCLLGVDRLEGVIADGIELVEILSILLLDSNILFIINYNLKILILIVSLREIRGVLLSTRRLKGRFHLHDLGPVQTLEEGMVLNLIDVI